MKENIMSEELYNELLKAYSKEVLASMIKQIYAVGFPNLMQECILLYDTSDRQKNVIRSIQILVQPL